MIKKSKIALGVATASLTLAGAMVSPTALAQTQAEKTAALQAQVNEMATMMQAMQAELSRVKSTTTEGSSVDSAKVQELDQWMASVRNAPAYTETKDNQFIVRGGWLRFDQSRGSVTDPLGAGTGVGTDILVDPVDDDSFYYGGAFNYNINNDMFGFWDGVSFQVEFGIEYSEVAERKTSGLTPAITALDAANSISGAGTAVPGGSNLQQSVTVNMLRVNASPKIKFNHGSKFRPWIIPLGLDFNVISPPSDAVTVLNTGMNFGAGADYELFRGISIGVDGRYHWSPDDIDGVNTDGYQLGGYLGFQF